MHEQQLSFIETFESSHRYPDSFPRVTRPVDSNFERDSLDATNLIVKIWDYYNFNQWEKLRDSSFTLYETAEHLLEQKINTDLVELWATGYVAYGQARVYLGELEAGARIMNEGLAIRQRVLGDNLMLAIEYYGAGHMAKKLLEDPELALDYYRAGEAIVRKLLKSDYRDYYDGLRNLGFGYFNKGDKATGLMYFQQIFDNPNGSSDFKRRLHLDLAVMLINCGEYEKALFQVQLGAPKRNDINARFSTARLSAKAYLGLKRYDECAQQLALLKKLVREFKKLAEKRGEHIDLMNLQSDYYAAINNLPQAIKICREAISAAEDLGTGKNSLDILEMWQTLTTYYVKTKQLNEAKNAVNELLFRETRFQSEDFTQNPPLSSFTRQPYHLGTLRNKGMVLELAYADSGNPVLLEAAVATYQKADSLIDLIRETYRGVGSKNQLANMAKPLYQRAIHCAYQLWENTSDQHYLDIAWSYAEKSKAIGLLEAFRDSEARQMVPINQADLEHETQIKRNLGYFEKMVYEEQNNPEPNTERISQFNQRIFYLKHSQDSLKQIFKDRYPEYYRLRCDKKIVTVRETQHKLGENTALVTYFLGEGELFAFLIDHKQFKVFRQETDSSFAVQIARLRACVQGGHSGPRITTDGQQDFREFITTAHTLYQSLLAEPLKHSAAKKLVIIPDDLIGYVPFACLLTTAPAQNQIVDYRHLPYLIQQRSIRFEYSANLMYNQPSTARSGTYLGMAPIYAGQPVVSRSVVDSIRFDQAFGMTRNHSLTALQYNVREAQACNAIFGGQLLTGLDASEANFKKYAPEASILHLPMHAFLNDSDPLFSTLVFSADMRDSTGYNDGFLHAYELYNFHLKASLVILSACQTGLGKIEKGEGIMSLARAFKYAGCPNIMMSLWSVDDYATQLLITNFFQQLQERTGKATALQISQQLFLTTVKEEELTHPYYWAPFVMVGDDTPVFPTNPVFWMITLLMLISSFLIAILFDFKKNHPVHTSAER